MSTGLIEIILIIGIAATLFTFLIFVLRTDKKLISYGWWIGAIIIVLGGAFILYLASNRNEITADVWAQIPLLTSLVAVTGLYAWSTHRMAQEMANTRYDAFRPIIDIEEMPMEATETFKHAFEAKEGKFPENLPCKLHNIGVGPAIGVSSFIIVPSNGGQQPWDFGTIARGDRTSEFRLSPQQIGDQMFLVVYYKDIYGRDVESRREVTLDEERHSWKIHPLETQVRKITKEGAQ